MNLGQSFAEYDASLEHATAFVKTPAVLAAADPARARNFFVGRRGTGKTAITRFVGDNEHRARFLHPEVFSPSKRPLPDAEFVDTHQKPFRSLMAACRRAMQDEVLSMIWEGQRVETHTLPPALREEHHFASHYDFDSRVLIFIDELLEPLVAGDEQEWIVRIKKPKAAAKEMDDLYSAQRGSGYTLLIDRVDENWDGSDRAVLYLTALMHACLEMSTQTPWARPLVFLRENIFERVRALDTEFARLETCVVGLDWTVEQLLELVERRLNLALPAKFALGGETWDRFFEQGASARELVFDYCQNRPRDVVTYCSLAIDTAVSHGHSQVMIGDLLDARRRYSDSRLKDLGDEYAENYPQIQVVLSRFYGLGNRFTLAGIDALVRKLLADDEVKKLCASWIYQHTAPELFVRLFYNVGFFGIAGSQGVQFRSLGPRDTTPPPISSTVDIVIHPSYREALDLQDRIIGSLDDDIEFGKAGVVGDLPGAISISDYNDKLQTVMDDLESLPHGEGPAARQYEDIVGEALRLCFFRALTNVEPKSRDVEGRVIRDWVASNRAGLGFWAVMRIRYDAVQVVWECKNYSELSASDFHQCAYYMTPQSGRMTILVFRGEVKPSHMQHVKRIAASHDGMLLLLTDQDMKVFLRQAKAGKVKEDHIQNIYDKMVRAIS